MRHQPSQSKPERPAKASVAAPKGTKRGATLASMAFLGAPFQGDGFAAMPSDTGSVLTAVLAVLAAILGLSASILYRHMHHRQEELRRRAEDAEAEQRALLMITDEAVLVLSGDGKVRAANPAAEELFGREADEFLGKALTEIIAQPLALGELTKHGPVNFETTARHGEAECSQVEMLLSPVDLSSGKGYLAVVHRAREAEAAGPAQNSELRSVVEKFTHDLNNQLTSVLGNLSLALMARPGDPATNDRVLNAKKTAIRAQVLSEQLQSLLNSPRPKTVRKTRTTLQQRHELHDPSHARESAVRDADATRAEACAHPDPRRRGGHLHAHHQHPRSIGVRGVFRVHSRRRSSRLR